MLPCKHWQIIKAVTGWVNSDSDASDEWEEIRVGLQITWSPLPFPSDTANQFRYPRLSERVSCSLGGFGFLAFAFLVFLLKSIHMSSEEVRVRLKRTEVQMVDL